MGCIECGNCKQNTPTYFCIDKNEIVINEHYENAGEKNRGGWKKGDPMYEIHRRKVRTTEVEL